MLIFLVNSGSTEMGHRPDDSPRMAGTCSTVGSTLRMKATEVPLDQRRQSWCRARQRAGDSHVSRDGCLESGTELQQPCPQNASNIRASERKHPEERRDDRNGPLVVRKPVLTALSEMCILHLRVLGNWSHSSMVAPTSRVTRTSSFTTRWMWEREKKAHVWLNGTTAAKNGRRPWHGEAHFPPASWCRSCGMERDRWQTPQNTKGAERGIRSRWVTKIK